MHLSPRRLGLGFAAILAVLLGLSASALVFLHTGPGERWLSGKLEGHLALELDGFHLRWPLHVQASYLRLKDAQGPWLEAEAPELRWHPSALLSRRVLDIDRLAAERVVVHRLPEASADGGGGGPPDLRFALHLDEIAVPILLEPPVLGETVSLDLGGTFQMQRGGGAVDVYVRSSGGGLVRLAGNAGPDFLDLRWYLQVPRLARWQRLIGLDLDGAVSGSGFIAGRLPSPAVSWRLDFALGQFADLSWTAMAVSGRMIPEGDVLRLSLMADLVRPNWAGRALPSAQLSLVGDVDQSNGIIRLGHARVQGGGVVLAGSGIMENWGRAANLRFTAEMSDLAPLGMGMSGGIFVHGQVVGDLLRPDLRGRVAAEGSHMATSVALLDRLLGPDPQLQAGLRVEGDRLSLTHGQIIGAEASLRASGGMLPRLNLWTQVDLPRLAVLAPSLTGGAVIGGKLRGSVADPSAFGIAQVNGVANGAMAFDLADLASAPAGPLSAALTLAGQPVEASARLKFTKDVFLDQVLVRSRGSQVSGALVIADGGVRGKLDGHIPQLKPWGAALGLPLAGRVEAQAVLDPARGQSLQISAHGQGLSGAGVNAGIVQLEADLSGLAAIPGGDIRLWAVNVARGDLAFDQIRARTSGDLHSVHLDAEGQSGRDGVSLGGQMRLDGKAGSLALERLNLRRDRTNAVLAAPAMVEWGPGRVMLQPARLEIGGGEITVNGALNGRVLSGEMRFQRMPLSLVELARPGLDAVGRVDGSARLDGTLDDPRAVLDMQGQGVGFAAAARAGIGRLATRLRADWRNGRVAANLRAEDGDRLAAAAEGSFPLGLDGARNGPVSAHVTAQGDVGRLTELLPFAGHVFAGHLSAEARLSGTMAAPVLDGRAALAQGRYENLEQGTTITGLTAQAMFEGDRVRFTASGGDGGKGSMKAEGEAGLDGRYTMHVSLVKFAALRRDDIEAELNGDLDMADGAITGGLTMPHAELDVGKMRGNEPAKLEVMEINRPGPAAAPKPPDKAASPPLTLAVGLKVDHAFVRGRGLDSEWQGKVQVSGTLDQPVLTGKLTAERGQFEVLGRPFRLTPESRVVFEGGDDIDPSLEVVAEARAEEITAQVEITGTAKAPQLAITSQPPLPQDEVLARLLFGSEAGKLSALQQIQLAQMAASGIGLGGEGGFDPISGIRGLLGLDVLGVGTAEDPGATGGPTLSAGKYIGRDTFVRVDQGTDGLGEVTVEQELGKGFSVETNMGQQSGGGVGLNWRKDY